MKKSNSLVFALIFAELMCVIGGFFLGKMAYQIKSSNTNSGINVVNSNDNYAVVNNFVAVLKDGKVYYNNSNDKNIRVYSDSNDVVGFNTFDIKERVMRIKTFNLESKSDTNIFLILENGKVMKINNSYNGLENFDILKDYKISDITGVKVNNEGKWTFNVILKDGSEKTIKK